MNRQNYTAEVTEVTEEIRREIGWLVIAGYHA